MKMVETGKQFLANGGDMGFRKDANFKDIRTKAAVEELRDNPQNRVHGKQSIVARGNIIGIGIPKI